MSILKTHSNAVLLIPIVIFGSAAIGLTAIPAALPQATQPIAEPIEKGQNTAWWLAIILILGLIFLLAIKEKSRSFASYRWH